MDWYEVEACLKHNKNKDSWEQARLITYMIAQVNSKKKLKPTDILSFEWDKSDNADTSISNEDIQRLKDKANGILKQLQNGGFSNQTVVTNTTV